MFALEHSVREFKQQLICELRAQASTKNIGSTTGDMIIRLALKSEQTESNDQSLDFLCRKIDIFKKLIISYDPQSGRASSKEILRDKQLLETMVIIIAERVLEEQKAGLRSPALLKSFNTLFNSFDMAGSLLDPDIASLRGKFEELWSSVFNLNVGPVIQTTSGSVEGSAPFEQHASGKDKTTLPLTVLFYEGPNSRAYLETIRELGFKPEKIIHLISTTDLATKKPVGSWMPHLFRTKYAAWNQRKKIHYWPHYIVKTHNDVYTTIKSAVIENWEFSEKNFANLIQLKDLSYYSDHVETFLVSNLKDEKLHAFLSAMTETVLLFTGGGILPESILTIDQIQMLHIHPGYLPDIRGADCAIWSKILKNQLSASCFYMVPGIDLGDVIIASWLPHIKIEASIGDVDTATLYRCIYSFIDPWIRAYVLRQVLTTYPSFGNIQAVPQLKNEGRTYYFMNPALKNAAVRQFFVGSSYSY